jgi:hypothetical protein
MIPYSSTYLACFSKLHFDFFGDLGSFSKLGVDNGLSLYMSPIPHPNSSHLKMIFIYLFFLIFMIPYSSTYPSFFTKLHFDVFEFLGAFQNLGWKIGCFEGAPNQGHKT